MENKGDIDTNCNWCTQYSHKMLDTGFKDLEIRGREDNIEFIALLKSARIIRVLETRGELLSFRLQWKPSALAGEKNLSNGEKSKWHESQIV